jgi:hypothetical protein
MLNPRGCPLSQMHKTLLAPADMKLDLFLKITANTLSKPICFPTPSSIESNTK